MTYGYDLCLMSYDLCYELCYDLLNFLNNLLYDRQDYYNYNTAMH